MWHCNLCKKDVHPDAQLSHDCLKEEIDELKEMFKEVHSKEHGEEIIRQLRITNKLLLSIKSILFVSNGGEYDHDEIIKKLREIND